MLLCLCGMIGGNSIGRTGEFEWMVVCTGAMLYAWVNPMISLLAEKWLPYLLQSVAIYVLLVFALLYMGKYLSPDKLNEHKDYQILMGMSLLFFVMTTIVSRAIKFIYNLTSKHF